MAIDTKVQVTLKNHTRIKGMRRGGSPEPSCQLPTAPAHFPSSVKKNTAHTYIWLAKNRE